MGKCPPLASPLCSRCGYKLKGLPHVGYCPECGQNYNLISQLGVRDPNDKTAIVELVLRRLRTFTLGLAAAVVFLVGCYLVWRQPGHRSFLLMMLMAGALGLAALTSYLYEKS